MENPNDSFGNGKEGWQGSRKGDEQRATKGVSAASGANQMGGTKEINLVTGGIREWKPEFGKQEIHMKVCDEGIYELLGEGDKVIVAIDHDYVPKFFPGDHCGDYIIFEIDAVGAIDNWSADADEVSEAFFPDKED